MNNYIENYEQYESSVIGGLLITGRQSGHRYDG